MSRRRQPERVRAHLEGGTFSIFFPEYPGRDLLASIKRIKGRLFHPEELGSYRLREWRPPMWSFPIKRLEQVRRLLAAHDIELIVPGDEFEFQFRYRDAAGRFVNPWQRGDR